MTSFESLSIGFVMGSFLEIHASRFFVNQSKGSMTGEPQNILVVGFGAIEVYL